MKIIKPDNLALLYRTLRFGRRDLLSLGLLGLFHFDRSNPDQMLPEAELWTMVAQALGDNAVLDEGLPKPAAEFMVYGAACAADGREVPQLPVAVRLGTLGKQLYVYGDREFQAAGMVSAPRPFARIEIRPENAFGGPGFADNPVGKGFAATDSQTGPARHLPNLESPRQLMLAAGDEPVPAGFWGITADAPRRRKHLGTFDDRWLKHSWPHLPEDTSLEFFHAAPADQRLPQFLAGDERFEIENMHPNRPHIESRLPGLRARCFVNRHIGGAETFAEIEARAETVWLFPDLECGIVLYRASVPIADSEADDVLHVMAEWEKSDAQPFPLAYYEQKFRAAIGVNAAGAATAIEPEPPASDAVAAAGIGVPAAVAVAALPVLPLPPDPELQAIERLTQELQTQTQELLKKYGLTDRELAAYMNSATEAPETTLEDVKNMTAKLEAEKQRLLQQHGMTDADIQKFQPPAEAPAASLIDVDAKTTELEEQTQTLLAKHGLSEQQVRNFYANKPGGADLAEILKRPTEESPQAIAGLEVSQPSIPAIAPMAVAAAAAPLIPEPPPQKLSREQVIESHRRGESFAGHDLSGLDLSGLDLSGADFSGALLENTMFRVARLAKAVFERALLQGADFTEADLSTANLADASAGAAVFVSARMDGSDARNADFTDGDFTATHLTQARLSGATFDRAKMAGLQAAGCHAEKTGFAGCDLSRADLGGAHLVGASFIGAKCAGANLAHAICDNAELYGADLTAASFAGSSLRGSRADAGTDFKDSVFAHAQLARANWEGATLSGANFENAVLDDVDFSRVQAAGAKFNRASAKGAKFARADLSRADLTAINLFKGSLRKAGIDGAVMRFANLYGVDFEGTAPTRASLEGSNIERTVLASNAAAT